MSALLTAYRSGRFPMHLRQGGKSVLCWWAPDPRAIIRVDGFRAGRSLRRARHGFDIRVDSAFDAVVDGCADPRRPHGWINDDIRAAYANLHRLGHAHCVEAWRDGELVGGVYGVAVAGLFAGESMFHRQRDASKAAIVALIEILADNGAGRILDVQWLTPHLASLGAVEVSRQTYEELLGAALELADVTWPEAEVEE